MRIVRYHEFGAPSVLRVDDAAKPAPVAGEVLIRVEAVGVNFAEVQRRQGIPIGGPAELPGSPGGDVAGVVEAIGAGVVDVAVGDRVVTEVHQDAYADYVVAPARGLLHVPAGIDAAQATALTTPAQTAYGILKFSAAVRPGETVLVDAAAGGVGHLAVQIAKALGAGTVIATASSEEKLSFAKSLGADHAFDYTSDDWADKVLEVTGGKGADVVLDTVGGDILLKSLDVLATFGRLVFYGSASGADIPMINPMHLFGMKTVAGFSVYAMLYKRPEEFAAGQRELLEFVLAGKVRPIVHTSLSLDEAVKAHEVMEARSQLGRVVLVP